MTAPLTDILSQELGGAHEACNGDEWESGGGDGEGAEEGSGDDAGELEVVVARQVAPVEEDVVACLKR